MSIFQTKEKDGTINIRVCGYLTKDPFVPESGKVVLFTVCYAKDKYMDCKAWGDKTVGELAACLERHDEVAVDGIYDSYTGKDGKRREQIVADHISVQQSPIARGSQEAHSGVETDSGIAPDGFVEEEDNGGELPF